MIPESVSTYKPHLQYRDYPAYTEMLDQRLKASSGDYFTGENENLVDVCEKDSKVLRERNITYGQIADKLEGVLKKAYFLCSTHRFKRFKAIIDGTLRVELVWLDWPETCPFSLDHKTCGKGLNTYNIINLTSNKCLRNVSELHAHMIRDHYFFQGQCEIYPRHPSDMPSPDKRSPEYLPEAHRVDRVDPELAIDVLGIQPGVDYKVQTITQTIWKEISYFSSIDARCIQAAIENQLEAHVEAFVPGSMGFGAFVLPYRDDLYPPEKDPNSKETYLHIFCHTPLSVEKTYQIGNAMLSSIDINKNGHTVYRKRERTGPMLGLGDHLAEEEIKS